MSASVLQGKGTGDHTTLFNDVLMMSRAATSTEGASIPRESVVPSRRRKTAGPLSAVRLAMITGWMPGDSYVWVGRLPVPVSRQAWREIATGLFGRRVL